MKATPTPTRATYHHGHLRRTLLETALKLVADRGPEGFSLREAARAVGVSPAAAYRHFADKPELLAALAAEGHGRLAAALERDLARIQAAEPRARAVEAMLAIGHGYVEFALKNPSFFRVMFGSRLRDAGYEPACAPSGRTAYDILADTLDGLVSSGAMPPGSRPGAEIIAWSGVHGFASLLLDGAMPFTARQRADAFRILWHGLLLALGCDPAVLPARPPRWKDPYPDHPERAQGSPR